MVNGKRSYFDLVYEDFLDRVKWYYRHGLISNIELYAIIEQMTQIKNIVVLGTTSQRLGVIELANVFREYAIM